MTNEAKAVCFIWPDQLTDLRAGNSVSAYLTPVEEWQSSCTAPLYPATEVERLEASLADAKARLASLYEAAERYFDGYCQDEASDELDGNNRGKWTGCPAYQIRDAIALRDALAGAAQP